VAGRITDYPFGLLLQRRGVTRDTFLGNIGFKCQKCGRAEPVLSIQSHTTPRDRSRDKLPTNENPRPL
jgi:hypothetical protein